MRRRLAAILAADIVGYSKLMSEDEAATLAALRHLRRNILEPLIIQHQGHLIKSMGDGWLIEFSSIADGVTCAIELQEELSSDPLLKLRIGLHIGDVTFEDEDIYGDGVNIASRLQDLAAPGSIVISDIARRTMDGGLSTSLHDLGPQNLKNIAEPVQAYGWGITKIAEAGTDTGKGKSQKPSIAVLPFHNLSGNPDQEYLADGITEDIITALSRVRQFFVVARNTAVQYKGQSYDVRQVSRDLGVRYVLEGSVRIAGPRARISAQFIDGETGGNVWGEQFDHTLDDIFAVQDAITQAVVGNLGARLSRAEQERTLAKPTDNLDAWELHHRGMFHLYKRSIADNETARDFFEKAIELDPNFSSPYAGIARSLAVDWAILGVHYDTIERVLAPARRSVELDPQDAFTHISLGIAHFLVTKDNDASLRAFREALSINPNDAQALNGLAGAYISAGDAGAALPHLEKCLQLGQGDSMLNIFLARMAFAKLFLRDLEEAVEFANKAIERGIPPIEQISLIAALAHLDRQEDAIQARKNLQTIWPNVSQTEIRTRIMVVDEGYLDILFTGLDKAGLPE